MAINTMFEEDSANAQIIRKNGISICPDSILFLESFLGESYTAKITFRNISTKKIVLRISKPYKQCFEINDDSTPKFISSGLHIVREVKFTCWNDRVKDSAFPIWIDDTPFDIPIRVKIAEAVLNVCPTHVNFGKINLGGRYVSKYLQISNRGGEVTSFSIDFGQNPLDLMAFPKTGTLQPYSTTSVRLDLAAFTTGSLYTQFWVKGSPSILVYVEVHVLQPFLQAIHPNTTARFTLIDFKDTYFGTIRYETLVVRNMSSSSATFVVLAEIENQLMTLDEVATVDQDKNMHYKNFSVEPMEGNLAPFESRIFTVWFHPTLDTPDKGWSQNQPTQEEYLCFLRVFKVDVRDWISKDNKPGNSSMMGDEDHDSLNVRLCLHGCGQKPQIGVLTTSFVFDNISLGEKVTRVIHMKNISGPTLFSRFVKAPGFKVEPQEKEIPGGKAVELILTFKPCSLDNVKKNITFDVLCHENLTSKVDKVLIGQLSIPFKAKVQVKTTYPKPSFNLGITPKLANEVGEHAEDVKFSNDIDMPVMMLIPSSREKTKPWLKSDARIAFPNDMPKSLRTKPTDKLKKTIFTGKNRYVPPIDMDCAFTVSESERIKVEENNYWKFLDENHKAKLNMLLKDDYESLLCMKSPSETRWYKRVEKINTFEEIKKKQRSSLNFKPHESIIPLSPKYLYNVRIMPHNLDFGQIPVDVDCIRQVAIENMNPFPILVYLHMQKDSTGTNDGLFKVGSQKRILKCITLNVPTFGRYHSNISFLINNNDCFDMTLTADVVHRSLSIVPREVIINIKTDDIFQMSWFPVRLINSLYVPTSFEWKLPLGCKYRIEPMAGTVPGQSNICCALYFQSTLEQSSNTFISLNVEGGISAELKVIKVVEKSHNVIVLIQKKMLPPISCYLPHYDCTLLFNAGFKDAIFSIVNPFPLEGVTISPIAGIIPSKSCFILDIEFNMSSIQAFDFNLLIRIQFKNTVEVKYVGFVFFPKVTFSPLKLELRNVPLHSLTNHTLKAENCGECSTTINFKMEDEFPQIHLSENKKYYQPYLSENHEFVLHPGGSKEFYLHFNPQNFATYEFLLPVVFNKKIGPPLLYDEMSENPLTYIKSAALVNKIMKHIDLSLPLKLLAPKIDVSIGRGHVLFSSWKLEFFVPNKSCSHRKYLQIKNLTHEVTQVSFDPKILTLSYAYYIRKMPKDGIYKIPPDEEISLQIVFCPEGDTDHDLEIPIFVKDYSSTVPYNYLSVSGVLWKPVLSVSQNVIHFMPIPVGVVAEKLIEVYAKHQPKNTKLMAGFKNLMGVHNDVTIEFSYPKGNLIPAYHHTYNPETVVPVILKFRSRVPISQQGSFYFHDEFDGFCEVFFTACANNSVMTCYNYLFLCQERKRKHSHYFRDYIVDSEEIYKIRLGDFVSQNLEPQFLDEILEFPMFPSALSTTEYAAKMRRMVQSVETWVFEQGFCGSFRMSVGEHIAFSKAFLIGQNWRSQKPQHDYIKSIIDLLQMYVGRDLFLEYQLPTTVPSDNSERINYSLNIYRQVLKFLRVQGGNVSHIFPVYLLSYEDYSDHLNELKYKTSDQKAKGIHFEDIFEETCSKKEFLPAELFERYHMLAWLDLFLQIHQAVVQSTIPYSSELRHCINKKRSGELSTRDDSADTVDSGTDRPFRTINKGDKILVDWINLIYTHARSFFPGLCIMPRVVSDIAEDLEDVVVLAVVTLHYCPYLLDDYFNNFFFDPSDAYQIHHNATQLLIAWSVIKLGLSVRPEDFYHPNPVVMMMIVTHLYQVLRSYVPERTIEFLACLTSSVSRKITLTNPNDVTIGYSIKIIGDYTKVFNVELSRSTIVILPRSSVKIIIAFSAKKLTPVKATLLLCGTTVPNGYVQNIALTLYGDPYNLLVSRDYTVSAPIMKPTFIIAKVVSPYSVEAEYEVWFADEEPSPGLLNIRPWTEVKSLKLPRSIFLNYDKIVIPPMGETPAPFSITAACFTRSVLRYWIILKNDQVGDFIVRVVLKPKVEIPSLIVRVPLPLGVCSGYPGSLCSSHCPRLLYVKIPSRNTRLWNTVKTMLLLTMNKGYAFWEEHYETRIGLDLMKWLLGKAAKTVAKEISFIFESRVKYKVTSLSPHVQVQSSLEIEDIHSREFVELMVHICCRINSDFCAEILLESESGQEVRLYRVKFYGEKAPEIFLSDCRKGCNLQESVLSQSCLKYHPI